MNYCTYAAVPWRDHELIRADHLFVAKLCSRFTFTQLDPIEPTRKFSFLLQVDNNDQYQIAKCQPSLEPLLLVEVAKVLNETDDMSYLVRMMRK
jgi:hypothetical protein